MAQGFVGVLDSGVGGISVLHTLRDELPHEDFYFYGDSAHAPYGEKTDEEVVQLVFPIAESMYQKGAKAIVVACNSATSAAIEPLRCRFDIPIIGIEPALKPACQQLPGKKILVMATPMTLALDKFLSLQKKYQDISELICVPCTGLAARIEQGALEASDLLNLLRNLIGCYNGQVDGVVLGCTHYSFIKPQIRRIVGDVPFFDGNKGTARQLRHLLAASKLLAAKEAPGEIIFESSIDTAEEYTLYKRFLELDI